MRQVGLCIFQAHFPDCELDGDKDNERNRVEENVCSGRIWWLLLPRTIVFHLWSLEGLALVLVTALREPVGRRKSRRGAFLPSPEEKVGDSPGYQCSIEAWIQ